MKLPLIKNDNTHQTEAQPENGALFDNKHEAKKSLYSLSITDITIKQQNQAVLTHSNHLAPDLHANVEDYDDLNDRVPHHVISA